MQLKGILLIMPGHAKDFLAEATALIKLAMQDDVKKATDEQVALGLEAFKEWLNCQARFFWTAYHSARPCNYYLYFHKAKLCCTQTP